MTALEKLKEEYPGSWSEKMALCCPDQYGYMNKPRFPDELKCNIPCDKCWDREIPGTEEKENKMIYAHVGPAVAEVEELTATDKGVTAKARILDSGNRRQFESGAVRDIQEGKGRCDLLPLDVVTTVLGCGENAFVVWNINEFQKTDNTGYLVDAIRTFTEMHYHNNIPAMILDVSIHFEEGAKKYGENNWQKGIPVHCYIDSAVRHYLKFLRGDKDEPHDRAFCWNILCAIWTCKHKPELNEYAQKDLDFPNRDYDPVAKAYDIAKSAYNGDQSNIAYALEEIVGYLGEVYRRIYSNEDINKVKEKLCDNVRGGVPVRELTIAKDIPFEFKCAVAVKEEE